MELELVEYSSDRLRVKGKTFWMRREDWEAFTSRVLSLVGLVLVRKSSNPKSGRYIYRDIWVRPIVLTRQDGATWNRRQRRR